jgi:hypothetical protein
MTEFFTEPSGRASLPSVLLVFMSFWIMSAWTVACYRANALVDVPSGAVEILLIASGLKGGVRAATDFASAYQNRPQPPAAPSPTTYVRFPDK